jgi:DNA-binding transcriptional regulator YiaG
MKKNDFESLLRGVDEVGAIIRGELKPTRIRRVEPAKVRSIRTKLGLSQMQFSIMIGVPCRLILPTGKERAEKYAALYS